MGYPMFAKGKSSPKGLIHDYRLRAPNGELVSRIRFKHLSCFVL